MTAISSLGSASLALQVTGISAGFSSNAAQSGQAASAPEDFGEAFFLDISVEASSTAAAPGGAAGANQASATPSQTSDTSGGGDAVLQFLSQVLGAFQNLVQSANSSADNGTQGNGTQGNGTQGKGTQGANAVSFTASSANPLEQFLDQLETISSQNSSQSQTTQDAPNALQQNASASSSPADSGQDTLAPARKASASTNPFLSFLQAFETAVQGNANTASATPAVTRITA